MSIELFDKIRKRALTKNRKKGSFEVIIRFDLDDWIDVHKWKLIAIGDIKEMKLNEKRSLAWNEVIVIFERNRDWITPKEIADRIIAAIIEKLGMLEDTV